MYTSAEIQLLRNADPGVKIPGIDTAAGNPLSQSSLKQLSALNSLPGVSYNATQNLVRITAAGTNLSGYNFGSATVYVQASNVTLNDDSFIESSGNYAIQGSAAANNLVVENSTFSNAAGKLLPLAAWITSGGGSNTTVTNNQFIDTPADGLHIDGGGVISGNYFSGTGYTSNGQHPDAIWVTGSTNPLTISNNFIDWSTNPNSDYGSNDCIRITTECGSVSNVNVRGNMLVGGGASIDAGNEGSDGTFSNISITNNYMGFANDFAFYPGPMKGVTQSGNVDFDWTNPMYAAGAWAAYKAAGVPTAYTVVSTNGANIWPTSNGPTTLYGSAGAHLYGGNYENNMVAGFGREFINGGAGANIFTFLTPNGDSVAVNPSVIGNFDPAKDVIDLSHIDANLTQAGLQSFTFIGTNAFTSAGAQVSYQQNPTNNTTMVEATLAGDTTPDLVIQLSGLITLTAANFALTAQQSTTDLADGAALGMTSVRSGDAFEYNYSNVKGRAYSSYAGIKYNNGIAANDLNLSGSANELDLYESNASVTRGAFAESYAVATASPGCIGGSFNLAYHANETIDVVGDAGAETFKFSSGFGNETINGFAPSGTNADTLQLSKSAFSYLNAGMTQAQDLAAVLSHATSGASTTIVDSHGDSVTLAGVATAALAVNTGAVKFV